MKVSTKKKIVVFTRYLTRIGLLRGLLLYIKFHVLNIQTEVNTGFLKFPVSLRNGTSDLATFDQVFISGIYNLPYKFKPHYIIDCGANVGMASIYFANKFSESTIIAIEPEHSNFEMLTRNCEHYKNIRVLRNAVSSVNGKMEVVDTGHGHYGYQVKELEKLEHGPVTKEIIESLSLDTVMKLYAWDRIDLLKIDIEGSEKELFSNNYRQWLSKTRSIAVEIHDHFVPGTSTAVIKAVINFDFSISGSAEGFFFVRNDMNV